MMQTLIDFVIRPPRADYSTDDLLGVNFALKGREYKRHDLQLVNKRGQQLACSHYKPRRISEDTILPCVIYCHGNSGCRADASEAAIVLLPQNITVFCLDFAGSGLSGGDYVTLGKFEMEDLISVVDHLRSEGKTSKIGLWGRSMGAVTCLMYGSTDPSIAGLVLDSPFSKLDELMMELVDTYKIRIPKFTVRMAVQYMRRSIKKKAGFDIEDLDTLKLAPSCFSPALFGHGLADVFIQPHHSDDIYKVYEGDKNIVKFEGDHNSPRPPFFYDSVAIFFHNVLSPPEPEGLDGSTPVDDDFNEETLLQLIAMMGDRQADARDEAGGTGTSTQVTRTGSDAEQLRGRWQMSHTLVPHDAAEENDEVLAAMLRDADQLFEHGEGSGRGSRDWVDAAPVPSGSRRDLRTLEENGFVCPRDAEDEEMMLLRALELSLQGQEQSEEQRRHSGGGGEGEKEEHSSLHSERIKDGAAIGTKSAMADTGVPEQATANGEDLSRFKVEDANGVVAYRQSLSGANAVEKSTSSQGDLNGGAACAAANGTGPRLPSTNGDLVHVQDTGEGARSSGQNGLASSLLFTKSLRSSKDM